MLFRITAKHLQTACSAPLVSFWSLAELSCAVNGVTPEGKINCCIILAILRLPDYNRLFDSSMTANNFIRLIFTSKLRVSLVRLRRCFISRGSDNGRRPAENCLKPILHKIHGCNWHGCLQPRKPHRDAYVKQIYSLNKIWFWLNQANLMGQY